MAPTTPKARQKSLESEGVVLVLAAAAMYLLYLIVCPFWKALFLAAVLAGAIHPWYARFSRRLGERRGLAAGLVTVLVLLILVVPTLALTFTAGREVIGGVKYVQ